MFCARSYPEPDFESAALSSLPKKYFFFPYCPLFNSPALQNYFIFDEGTQEWSLVPPTSATSRPTAVFQDYSSKSFEFVDHF